MTSDLTTENPDSSSTSSAGVKSTVGILRTAHPVDEVRPVVADHEQRAARPHRGGSPRVDGPPLVRWEVEEEDGHEIEGAHGR